MSTFADLRENAPRQIALIRRQPTRPRSGTLGATPHRADQMRPGSERKRGENSGGGSVQWQMMLEGDAPFRRQRSVITVQVPHQVALPIANDAIAGDETLRPIGCRRGH